MAAPAQDSAALLRQGLALHQAGQWRPAERLYRRVLAHESGQQDLGQADALHLLGLIAQQTGHPALAATRIRRAIGLRPGVALFHANLARAQGALGHWADAAASLRAALVLAPDDAGCWRDLALAQDLLGQPEAALASLAQAEVAAPHEAGLPLARGALLARLGRVADAAAAFRVALARDPLCPDAARNLAAMLFALGQFAAAGACLRDLLERHKQDAEAWNILGNTLRAQGDAAAAEAALRQAGTLAPGNLDFRANLANALADQNQMVAAEAEYRAVLAADPAHADARTHLGKLLLQDGRWVEGWAAYESRWQRRSAAATPPGSAPPGTAPRWQGDALGARTLLLTAEQGYGDTLQFCRFIPGIAARAPRARLLLQVPPPLLRLLRGLPGVAELFATDAAPPLHDLACSLPSLPFVLGTTPQTLPPPPDLPVPAAEIAAWRGRLAPLPGQRVGVVWAGNHLHAADHRRSIPPALLAPLASVAGISLVSLQWNGAAPDALKLFAPLPENADFADTAGLIAALDLVIGVDTAVIHLAATLGRPAWLLNRFESCWRWPRDRDDCPWYPALRQFRQAAPGDWAGVVARVVAALRSVSV